MKNHAAILQDVPSALPPETDEPSGLCNRPVRKRREIAGSPVLLPQLHHIQLNLNDINQLFNTMDPSPFHQKDLDRDAEEFILSWVQEFHRHDPVDLIIHLKELPGGRDTPRLVEEAVHNYFAYRARLNRMELKRLLKQGRMSLLVGLSFLGLCLLIIELLLMNRPTGLPNFLTQSLTIAGWVAMWRPMETYLYDWWPLRTRGKIFEKLSKMPVELRKQQ